VVENFGPDLPGYYLSSLVLKRAMSTFLHFSKEADFSCLYSMPVSLCGEKSVHVRVKKWTWPVLVLDSSFGVREIWSVDSQENH